MNELGFPYTGPKSPGAPAVLYLLYLALFTILFFRLMALKMLVKYFLSDHTFSKDS